MNEYDDEITAVYQRELDHWRQATNDAKVLSSIELVLQTVVFEEIERASDILLELYVYLTT